MISLSENAVIEREEIAGTQRQGNLDTTKWWITDENKKYTVIRERGKLGVYGRRAAKGGLFATMVLLMGMVGQYMGGHSSDRWRKTRLYLLFNLISLPFMFLIGLTYGGMLIVFAALFAVFHFANQPVENNLIAHYTPSRLRSSSYGLKFFLTFGIGSFASGFSGYMADHYGLNSVFLALSGVIVLIVIVILFLNLAAKEEMNHE